MLGTYARGRVGHARTRGRAARDVGGQGQRARDGTGKDGQSSAGVQSVERAFELLEVLADAGGELSLSQIAASSALPMPTIHRIIRTLVNRGYVRQLPSRRYALGPR